MIADLFKYLLTESFLLGSGAIILVGLTYFATKAHINKGASESRVQSVLNLYLNLARSGQINGITALVRSGISILTDDEIASLSKLLQAHGEIDHIGLLFEKTGKTKLQDFFQSATKRKVNFIDSRTAEAFILEYKNSK